MRPRSARPRSKQSRTRGVQLVGSSLDATALAAYHQLQERYASILGGRKPRVLHHGLARGSIGWARVHVGTESRASAEKLCGELRSTGGHRQLVVNRKSEGAQRKPRLVFCPSPLRRRRPREDAREHVEGY